MFRRRFLQFVVLALGALTLSCSASLYKVKPVVELPALPENSRSASAGGVTVRVAPLMSDEEIQDLFEANLLLAGVLPIRMEMAFESGVPVELKKAKLRLRDNQNREWKLLTPKAAISRILSANGVYAYNPNSRKQFEKEFTAYALDLKSPLSDADRRHRGFVFFQTPDKQPVERSQGLELSIQGLPQNVNMKISE
jgi:hypothetical protein